MKADIILALEGFVLKVTQETEKRMATSAEVSALPEVAKIILDYSSVLPASPDTKN